MDKKKKQRGFTLIELLVVVAIIGLISGIVLSALSTARTKGQNAKRVSDLNEIRNALALYYSDYGVYPSSSGPRGECSMQGGYASNLVIPGLVPTYMSSFPSDPTMNKSANTSCYFYIGVPAFYLLEDYNIDNTGHLYMATETEISYN